MEGKARAAEASSLEAKGEDALKQTILAADLYMRAVGEATTKVDAARLRKCCQNLIQRAEILKSSLSQQVKPLTSNLGNLSIKERGFLTPNESYTYMGSASASSASELANISPKEDAILMQGSILHGNTFPPWIANPTRAEFDLLIHEQLFIDTSFFKLSTTQQDNFLSWTRAKDLLAHSIDSQDDEDVGNALMDVESVCDLVQDITTDCSVVASLSAAVNVLRDKNLKVLSSIFHPYDHDLNRPMISPNGKYILRLHFNGCPRKVVIDDTLPASKSDRALFVMDRLRPCLLWPALLEKAYLKVRGGYDFPGSNSGTDLWVLTGWVPEQLFLQREDFDANETWSRIKGAYVSRDVIITLGTGRISAEEEELVGLVGEHDYAVQDMIESEEARWLLLKNPWRHVGVQNAAGWLSRPGLETSNYRPPSRGGTSEQLKQGTLWVTVEDVAQHFESMYLNWNPQLFTFSRHRHFCWDVSALRHQTSLVGNPQFSLASSSGTEIWILVSRHFQDAELEIARNRSGSMASVSCQLGFMSVRIFNRHNGCRVPLRGGEIYRGPFVDSPQTLARFVPRPGHNYTVVIDQHQLPLDKYSFTISTFSDNPVQPKEALEALPFIVEREGAWGRTTAGGNTSFTTYFTNPQFVVSIITRSKISVLLSADCNETHVHVDVVWANGNRARNIRAKDVLASSGEYTHGSALVNNVELDPGRYTIVCSTFHAGHIGSFTLRATATSSISLDLLPNDAAGKLRTTLTPYKFAMGDASVRARLWAISLTRASIAVQVVNSPSSASNRTTIATPMVRVSIIYGSGPDESIIAQSGDGSYQESKDVLWTPDFDIEPHRLAQDALWLVIECLSTNVTMASILGDIFSDSSVQIGLWEKSE